MQVLAQSGLHFLVGQHIDHAFRHILEGRNSGLPALENLDNLGAVFGFDDVTHIARIHLFQRLLEFRSKRPCSDETNIATLISSGAVGIFFCDLGKPGT